MDNDIMTPGFQAAPVIAQGSTQLINQGPGPQIGEMHGDIVYNQIPPDLLKNLNTLLGQMQTPCPVCHALEWASLSHEQFCLFVLDNENYSNGSFAISKDRALSKYTQDADYFRPLTPSLIGEILKMPCIFSKRNLHHRFTDADHPVIYGKLTEIIPQGSVIRFHFELFKVDYQQTINQNMTLFGLMQRPLHNQLDEEHWCIRSGNLPAVLAKLGIVIE